MKYVIGLDNGGTVVKAALFDIQGKELCVASSQTPIETPHPGFTERDMDSLFMTNCQCVKEVIEKSKVDVNDIVGMSVCGHGKGLYVWGKDNKPAYNGIVSTDGRAWRYPIKWDKEGITEKYLDKTCQSFIACQQAPLLAWLKDNDRAVYDNIKYVFSVKDYIRFRLTGEAYCEATDISGSGLMNIKDKCFDKQMLEDMGIGEMFECLPKIVYSYEKCGKITSEASKLTGLKEGTAVAAGMFDIDSCAVAMDVTTPDKLCVITGTWSINEYISTEPVFNLAKSRNSLYAVPGYYLIEEGSATGAGNLEWFITELMNNPKRTGDLYDDIAHKLSSIDPEECDVYYLPFLYGCNTHPLGKASFIGLTSFHNIYHMLLAVYEGVAFGHRLHIERLLEKRERPTAIRIGGGAMKSKFWAQLFADILNMPIETVTGVKELGALGCGMSACVAAGVYKNYEEAASNMVHVNAPLMPNPQKAEIYEKKYQKYKALCNALDTVWDKFTV
jgi:L-xylulokinase